EIVFEAGEGMGQALSEPVEFRLVGFLIRRRVFWVLHRQDVLRRAHEHCQMADLVGDRLDDLNSGRANPYDPDPLAGELDRLLRPPCSVDQLSFERLLSGEKGSEWSGQHAAAGDEEL